MQRTISEEDRDHLIEMAKEYLCSADALESDLRGYPDHPNNPVYDAAAKSHRRHADLCLRLAGAMVKAATK